MHKNEDLLFSFCVLIYYFLFIETISLPEMYFSSSNSSSSFEILPIKDLILLFVNYHLFWYLKSPLILWYKYIESVLFCRNLKFSGTKNTWKANVGGQLYPHKFLSITFVLV